MRFEKSYGNWLPDGPVSVRFSLTVWDMACMPICTESHQSLPCSLTQCRELKGKPQTTSPWPHGVAAQACLRDHKMRVSSIPTAAVLCPWARHFTPRKYWLMTQEAVAPSRHDWKIVDWDVKPQHKQTKMRVTKVPFLMIWLLWHLFFRFYIFLPLHPAES